MKCSEFVETLFEIIVLMTVCFNPNLENGLVEKGYAWTLPESQDKYLAVTARKSSNDTLRVVTMFREETFYGTLQHEASHIGDFAFVKTPEEVSMRYAWTEAKAEFAESVAINILNAHIDNSIPVFFYMVHEPEGQRKMYFKQFLSLGRKEEIVQW